MTTAAALLLSFIFGQSGARDQASQDYIRTARGLELVEVISDRVRGSLILDRTVVDESGSPLGPRRTLHRNGSFLWACSGLSYAESDSAWCATVPVTAGNTSRLQIWHGGEGPTRTQVIESVEILVDEETHLRQHFLESPHLIGHNGEFTLVASTRLGFKNPESILGAVWSSKLDSASATGPVPYQRLTQASLIGHGLDPQVAVRGQDTLVAVRQTKDVTVSRYTSVPVLFYRSADGATWTLDEALSGGIRCTQNYRLSVVGDTLYLATLSDRLETWTAGFEDPRSVQLQAHVDGSWKPVPEWKPALHVVGDPVKPFWMFPSGTEAPVSPELFYLDKNRTLVRATS